MQKLTPHNKFADTLLRKTGKMSQKFTVLAEFSAVLAEFSTSIAKKRASALWLTKFGRRYS